MGITVSVAGIVCWGGQPLPTQARLGTHPAPTPTQCTGCQRRNETQKKAFLLL